jgi:hypothetical protein
MIGFNGTYLQLQSIITAHTLNSFWTTSFRDVLHRRPIKTTIVSHLRITTRFHTQVRVQRLQYEDHKKLNSVAFSPQANYADRATVARRRS